MTTTAPDMGGRGGFDVKAFGPGPKVKGGGGIGAGIGTGRKRRQRWRRERFRRPRNRHAKSDARPLRWNQSHRTGRRVPRTLLAGPSSDAEGNWSLKNTQQMCKDKTCTGVGSSESLSAATAHRACCRSWPPDKPASNGPFQRTIHQAVSTG